MRCVHRTSPLPVRSCHCVCDNKSTSERSPLRVVIGTASLPLSSAADCQERLGARDKRTCDDYLWKEQTSFTTLGERKGWMGEKQKNLQRRRALMAGHHEKVKVIKLLRADGLDQLRAGLPKGVY